MLKINITPLADADLDEAAAYIAKDNIKAALKLYDYAKETLTLLAEHPLTGTQYHTATNGLSDVRFFPMKKYTNYLVFYIPFNDEIRIIRILHRARNIPEMLA